MDIIKTSDGGFAIAGSAPNAQFGGDQLVMKIDANGNIQWQRRMSTGAGGDNATGIVEDNHGGAGLIVAGNVSGSSTANASISKLALATGNLLWTKVYDIDNRNNWLGTIHAVSDGLVFGLTNADGTNSEGATVGILKTDFNGDLTWAKEFTIANCRDARMTVLPDGSFAMVEGEFPHDAASDNYLMRISASGTIMWAKRYPREGAQFLSALVADGDYIVGAGLAGAGSYNDVLLAKSDLNGKWAPALQLTLAPRLGTAQ